MQVFFLQPKRHLFVDFPLLNKVLRLHANIFICLFLDTKIPIVHTRHYGPSMVMMV